MTAPKWERVADRLACPDTGALLRRERDELVSTEDPARRYPIVSGVPVLLGEEERRRLSPDLDGAELMTREYRGNLLSAGVKLVKLIVGSTLHLPVSKTVRRLFDDDPDGLSLEVGSGVVSGPPGQLNLDIGLFPNVDVVGSVLQLPFVDGTFDRLRNIAVLEHVREPGRMIAEIRRVMRPGGHVYTEVPFLQHFHAYPNDFQRYTVEGLKEAFREFEVVETGVCVGPSSAITALVADWVELLTFTRIRWINDLVRLVPLILLLPLKFLDLLVRFNPRAHEVASGIYLLARKPG